MKYSLASIVVCPVCQSSMELRVLAETGVPQRAPVENSRCAACTFPAGFSTPGRDCAQNTLKEIIDGVFSCRCGESYAILGGIPVFLPRDKRGLSQLQARYGKEVLRPKSSGCFPGDMQGGSHDKTALRFGYEWTRYPSCFAAEEQKIFFEETQLTPQELNGKLVLDAGCGMGRFTRVAGTHGGEIIGADVSDSVYKAYALTRDSANVHIIQADLLRLPFRDGVFDIVYSLGVLHHTPSTQKSFEAVAAKLKTGGVLSIWVYGTAGRYGYFKTNPLRPERARYLQYGWARRMHWLLVLLRENCSNGLRLLTVRMPHRLLYAMCHVLALLGKVPVIKYLTFSVHSDWRVRLLENFDWLAPPFQYHHAKEEVLEWYADAGFDIQGMLRHGFIPKVGVRGRKK